MLERLAEHQSAQEKILEASKKLFCRDGIHATGVARIIKESGVARRTLYERYGSKESLLKAVFASEADMWFRWFDGDLSRPQIAPAARVLMLFVRCSRLIGQFGGLVKLFPGCIYAASLLFSIAGASPGNAEISIS